MTSPLRAVWLLARRSLVSAIRRPVVLTFSLAQPALWMLLFGPLMSRAFTSTEARYVSFVAPGIVGLTLLFGSSQIGVSLVKDAQSGMLSRMVGAGAPASVLLLGKLLGDVVRLGIQAALVLLLGLVAGASFTPHLAQLPWVLATCLVLVVIVGSVSASIACATRQPEVMGTFVHLVNIPLLFTSTALVEDRHLPSVLARVAPHNPLSLFAEAARAMLLGHAPPSASRVAVTAALALACFVLASWLYSRAGTEPDR